MEVQSFGLSNCSIRRLAQHFRRCKRVNRSTLDNVADWNELVRSAATFTIPASEDSTARLWEAESGKLLVTFQGQTGGVYSKIFSPDGRRVLTASGSLGELWVDL